ncbi:transposase [Mesorhizobium sp. SP-1A]|uniref:RNA-guided endonuclease InsQ/TnpB family protein n=1 Tax=Mesorhizobium sp. SP-1A TaxID=3077840 RepID=UPI0028F6D0F1|nr:transposase [Mesorhizobium sp. SP-1A]
MKQLTAYKFRIYPDAGQERLFRRTAGCCRFIYNLCLEQRKMAWNRLNPTGLSAVDQNKELGVLKEVAPFLKEVPHHCLQQAVIDLQKAYVNFFKGRAAYPKPRKKFENESFRFPDPKQIFVRDDAIFLPKAKWVKMVMHRPIIGTIKNATVSTSGDHWYVAIQVEQEVDEPVVGPMVERSMDLGVVKPICMDDGEVFDLPRMSDKEKKKEATLQQRIARRKKGSKNQLKAKRDYRRFKAKIARRRKDQKHKATTKIADSCNVLYMERLKVKNLTASARGTVEEPGKNVAQKAGSNRSMLDVSPGETKMYLEYKLRRRGGIIVYVNPAYTSQRCSVCGHVDASNRPERDVFSCVSCGHAACADHNAARNILELGRKVLTTEGPSGLACGSNRVSGRKQELSGRSKAAIAA